MHEPMADGIGADGNGGPAMMSRGGGRRRRARRNWPICPQTGKQRLGERKDAKQALEAARHQRAGAAIAGDRSGWTVRREYPCEHCRGWHLTTLASWTDNSPDAPL